ncbi:MAG: hypothetical protein HOE44_10965 [Candidatus Marinimicrobia bacterium]|jgi:uncharacterized protein|nr:hypothetical protein [Candidatus Neomarinimicrobiota bacterium]
MWEDLKEGIKDLLTFGGRSARETRRINEQQLRMSVYALKISVYTLIFAVVVVIVTMAKDMVDGFENDPDLVVYYDDKILKYVGYGTYENREGEWEWYSERGDMLKKESYSSNALDGRYVEFFENGNVKVAGGYKSGEKAGVWRYFNDDGSLKSELDYEPEIINKIKDVYGGVSTILNDDSMPDGKDIIYYSSGEPKVIREYMNGLASGQWIFLDQSGITTKVIKYSGEGDAIHISYYENGVLSNSEEVVSIEGEEDVVQYVSYFENGMRKEVGLLVDGAKFGVWKTFRKDGSVENEVPHIKEEGYFSNIKKYISGLLKRA